MALDVVAPSPGPVALNDPSEGLASYGWLLRVDNATEEVYLARARDDLSAFQDEILIFDFGLSDPVPGELDVAAAAIAGLLETTQYEVITSGRLARNVANDAQDPFDINDWTGINTSNLFVDGTDGALLWETFSAQGWARYDALAARAQVMIQVRLTKQNDGFFSALAVHMASDTSHTMIEQRREWLNDGRFPLAEIVNGAFTHLAGDARNTPQNQILTPGDYHNFALWVNGNAECEDYSFTDDLGTYTAPVALSIGKVGVWMRAESFSESCKAKVFNVHAGKFVTIQDAPVGGDARILDGGGAVLASASESGGTIEIDCLQVWLEDAVDVEIRDSGGGVISTVTPQGGIWGGDVLGLP